MAREHVATLISFVQSHKKTCYLICIVVLIGFIPVSNQPSYSDDAKQFLERYQQFDGLYNEVKLRNSRLLVKLRMIISGSEINVMNRNMLLNCIALISDIENDIQQKKIIMWAIYSSARNSDANGAYYENIVSTCSVFTKIFTRWGSAALYELENADYPYKLSIVNEYREIVEFMIAFADSWNNGCASLRQPERNNPKMHPSMVSIKVKEDVLLLLKNISGLRESLPIEHGVGDWTSTSMAERIEACRILSAADKSILSLLNIKLGASELYRVRQDGVDRQESLGEYEKLYYEQQKIVSQLIAEFESLEASCKDEYIKERVYKGLGSIKEANGHLSRIPWPPGP